MGNGLKLMSVQQAVEMATGQRVNPSTCWRWAISGSGGVVLKTWLLGGRRVTTIEEVIEFLERKTALNSRSGTMSKTRAKLEFELGGPLAARDCKTKHERERKA